MVATQPAQSQDPPIVSEDSLSEVPAWKILAKEAAEEQDPDKLMEIVSALTRALDEDEEKKHRGR